MRNRIRLKAGPIARLRYAATSTASKILALLGVLVILGGTVWFAIPNIPHVYHAAVSFIDHHGSIIRDDISIAKELTNAPETVAVLTYQYEGDVFLTQTRACLADAEKIDALPRQKFETSADQLESKLTAFIPDEAEISASFEQAREDWAEAKKRIVRVSDPLPAACAAV